MQQIKKGLFKPGFISGVIIFTLYILVLTSCGYRFSGGGNLPGLVEDVHVTLFDNRVSEAGLEVIFTNDLVDELIQNGRSVKKSVEGVQGIIKGTIRSLTTENVTRRKSESVSKKEIVVVVDVRMNSQAGKKIWSANGITERLSYDTDGGQDDTTSPRRRDAISQISQRIAEKIYSRMTDQF